MPRGSVSLTGVASPRAEEKQMDTSNILRIRELWHMDIIDQAFLNLLEGTTGSR